MKLKNVSKFYINGLNQERVLNQLSKKIKLFNIDRKSKTETSFKCSYFDTKKAEKILKDNNVEYLVESEGVCHKLHKLLTCYGVISALVVCSTFYFFQYQYVLDFQISGNENLTNSEVVEFLKQNTSSKKSDIDLKQLETDLAENFEEISFASCIIKGQTLVVNIKEKLMPEQIYGDFKPIIAQKDGKIKEINLISGTSLVKVGDIVQAGDVLVEPYVIDTSGETKQVEAKAEIVAEVYNTASVDHYEKYVEIKRTGNTIVQNEIRLFGLNIYQFKEDLNFEMYEVEYEDVELIKNLFLPFKIRKATYYELSESIVESKFEDVKDEFIEKAKQKALENCEVCDIIIEEYYTLRHLAGVTIVNYCIVSEEQIGGIS